MKEYLKDLIPRVKKFSSKLDILTLLVSKNWVLVNNIQSTKKVFIFKRNNQLLISENGSVSIGKWEHLNSGSLLLFFQNTRLLFSHGVVDDNILILKLDGTDLFYVFEKEESAGLVNTKQFTKTNLNIDNSHSDNLQYQIIKETEGWGGKYIEFELLFNQNLRGKVIYNKEKKVYYHAEFNPRKYFQHQEECIENLKFHLYRKK